jgi:hypothetical protein
MSDNREEAQQELVDAGIEDALGVSGGFALAYFALLCCTL